LHLLGRPETSLAPPQADLLAAVTATGATVGFDATGGGASPGRQSHSDTTLYISSLILHTKYTGARDKDFNVYA
jgi:hypothetical protein